MNFAGFLVAEIVFSNSSVDVIAVNRVKQGTLISFSTSKLSISNKTGKAFLQETPSNATTKYIYRLELSRQKIIVVEIVHPCLDLSFHIFMSDNRIDQ